MPILVSKDNHKSKEKKFKAFLAITGSIIAIISSTVITINNLQPKILGIRKPSISTNQLNYYVSKNINTDTPIYELQSNEPMDKEEIEYRIDNTTDFDVQEVIITNNNSKNDICLTEFKLVVENITVDYSPNVSLKADHWENNKISFMVENKGWQDLSNVKLELQDQNNALDLKKYDTTINNLEYGTCDVIQYEFKSNDFYGSDNFNLIISVKYNENTVATYNLSLQYENGKLLVYPEAGAGGGRFAYGICFSTNESSFTCTENIQENITAGKALELPVLLFPDKSCSFDYYIEFKVDNSGKAQTIRTDKKHSKYIISSLADLDKYNCKNEAEILNYYECIDLITYPYCKKYQKK